MIRTLVIFTLLLLAVSSRNITAQPERRLIREGNRLYQKEQFDESELSYRRALDRDAASLQARFNLGNSLYRQDRFDEATRFFGELADEIDDASNRSRVFHNLGNSLLMSGQVEQSIEAYKEALRNNPGDEETRYNLAFARQLLDESQNQPQGDDGDQEDGDGEESEPEEDPGDQDNEGEGGENQPDDPGNDEKDQDAGRESRQVSPEDALRMLEAAEREEKRVQEKLMENRSAEQQPRSGRNW